ncbi:MAG: cytochrome C oxidase subunit IV family protein [Phycisphaerales bacterium JB040]
MSDAHAHADHHTPEHDLDPHGVGHHEHVILSWQLLAGVLVTLLFLTALTVFTAQAEQWIMDTWQIEIPRWVNIVGAMSIATVKALLVCAFFMQLKYDKPLNSIVMLFCLFCVWLFLMFSMIDLGNRDKVIAYRAEVPSAGGTGYNLGAELDTDTLGSAFGSPRLSPHVTTGNQSLPEYVYAQALADFEKALAASGDGTPAEGESEEAKPEAKKKVPERYLGDPYYIENPERAFWHYYYEKTYLKAGKTPHHHERDTNHYFDSFLVRFHDELAAKGLDAHHDDGHDHSDANRSRPARGLTAGLFDAADDHAQDTHAGEDHAPTDDH